MICLCPNIDVHLVSEVEDITGYVGNFKSYITDRSKTNGEVGQGIRLEVEHGVVIVATGGQEYVPEDGRFLYSRHPAVVTQAEFEQALASGAFPNGESDHGPVVMMQCVGSREEERGYCSIVCCSEAVKNAIRLKRADSRERRVHPV